MPSTLLKHAPKHGETITHSQLINMLSVGLKHVDSPKVLKLIEENGIFNTARILGYDTSYYDNLMLSGRLVIYDLYQRAPATIQDYVHLFRKRLNNETKQFLTEHKVVLQQVIDEYYVYDYEHDWFSGHTMAGLYSARLSYNGKSLETPSQTWMRIAVQECMSQPNALQAVIETYKDFAIGYWTPASPTIFNAGFRKPQMCSCFLLTIGDNLNSILGTGIHKGGMISKLNGGLGFDVSRIRVSEIGDVGKSNGLIPMLQLYNDMVRYVDQGGGLRKGAATIFLRPHHLDTLKFIRLAQKDGTRYDRAHDILTALWLPWLFFERVSTDGDWTMFCPAKCSELNDVYGKEFEALYIAAESDPSIDPTYKSTMKARELYSIIINSQIKDGSPFLLNCDACNLKSNQRHLGYIRCSNLCLEIIEFTSEDEIASCNLSSISMRMFVKKRCMGYEQLTDDKDLAVILKDCVDFDHVGVVMSRMVVNLNSVIDHNNYPLDEVEGKETYRMVSGGEVKGEEGEEDGNKEMVPMRVRDGQVINVEELLAAGVHRRVISSRDSIRETENEGVVVSDGRAIPGMISKSNRRHRPLGLGLSGWAEAIYELDICYDEQITTLFNKMFFACMYFNALASSVQQAILRGPHPSFPGSPFSKGLFQFDLWREEFELLQGGKDNAFRKRTDDDPIDPLWWGQKPIPLFDAEGNQIDVIQPNWDDLKRVAKQYGTSNSLLLAGQPTASTAQVRRNCESMELHQSMLYSRKVLKGSYPVLNRYMVWDLDRLGLWNKSTLQYIKIHNGSLQGFDKYVGCNVQLYGGQGRSLIPTISEVQRLERKYKGMFEVDPKRPINLCADRGRYIDQSQSFNNFIAEPSLEKMQAIHMYAFRKGLKTIMYYLRQLGGTTATFTADLDILEIVKKIADLDIIQFKDEDKESKDVLKMSGGATIVEVGGVGVGGVGGVGGKIENKIDEVDHVDKDRRGAENNPPLKKVVCNDLVCLSCT